MDNIFCIKNVAVISSFKTKNLSKQKSSKIKFNAIYTCEFIVF